MPRKNSDGERAISTCTRRASNCSDRLRTKRGQCDAPGTRSPSALIIWQPLHTPSANAVAAARRTPRTRRRAARRTGSTSPSPRPRRARRRTRSRRRRRCPRTRRASCRPDARSVMCTSHASKPARSNAAAISTWPLTPCSRSTATRGRAPVATNGAATSAPDRTRRSAPGPRSPRVADPRVLLVGGQRAGRACAASRASAPTIRDGGRRAATSRTSDVAARVTRTRSCVARLADDVRGEPGGPGLGERRVDRVAPRDLDDRADLLGEQHGERIGRRSRRAARRGRRARRTPSRRASRTRRRRRRRGRRERSRSRSDRTAATSQRERTARGRRPAGIVAELAGDLRERARAEPMPARHRPAARRVAPARVARGSGVGGAARVAHAARTP